MQEQGWTGVNIDSPTMHQTLDQLRSQNLELGKQKPDLILPFLTQTHQKKKKKDKIIIHLDTGKDIKVLLQP